MLSAASDQSAGREVVVVVVLCAVEGGAWGELGCIHPTLAVSMATLPLFRIRGGRLLWTSP